MNDTEFLKLAIQQSMQSAAEGSFPAGAIVVRYGEIIASGVSDMYPGYQHAECKAVDSAFSNKGILNGATLCASMEPCLMCLARAYWAGIRKIVYAISKDTVHQNYYEGLESNSEIVKNFNEIVEYIHISDMEDEALKVVRGWEEINKPTNLRM